MTVGINGSEESNNVALMAATKQISQSKLYFPCAFLYIINMHTTHGYRYTHHKIKMCVHNNITVFYGFTLSR